MELQRFLDQNDNYLTLFKEHHLIVKRDRKNNLCLVKNNYNKPLDSRDENDSWKMYCRGAIINTETNQVVCLPPVKAREINHDEIDSSDHEIQELIDGTMVNLFYHKDQWMISTRSEIGGYNKWLNKKSFRTLFDECCKIHYEELNPLHSYSFVMRHIENRNVSPIAMNELYLVEVYSFEEGIQRFSQDDYPKQFLSYNILATVPDLSNVPFSTKGYTLKKDSQRYKIINPKFTYVKELKMNHNTLMYNYLELRKNGALKEYLQYFPEHCYVFGSYRDKVHNLSNDLYSTYKNTYIYKNNEKKEIPYHLKPLIREIHQQYLSTKNPTTWDNIKDYIYKLPSKKLMFAMNHSSQ
tara:strand:+ start:2045 stop:3103 length:1059 start_codon:yes stop_codon:yes gene_type:complete